MMLVSKSEEPSGGTVHCRGQLAGDLAWIGGIN
jgi:hypothetical protein